MTSRIARTCAIAALSVGMLASAPAAMAQTPTPSTSTTTESSCVLYAGADTVHCFDSSAQQAGYERSGRMEAWVVVGYFYSSSHYAGSVLTVKAPTACDADTRAPDWSWSKITPSWNNRVRSFVTRNHCDLMGYDGYDYTGEHFVSYTDHDIYMPYWGGRISSFRMS